MTTPNERIRAAWATGDRLALHREVEELAAAGHSQQTLENALEELLLEVRAAGADDDTEEIINGVWDRLTGWCDASRHIRTPPDAPVAGVNGKPGSVPTHTTSLPTEAG